MPPIVSSSFKMTLWSTIYLDKTPPLGSSFRRLSLSSSLEASDYLQLSRKDIKCAVGSLTGSARLNLPNRVPFSCFAFMYLVFAKLLLSHSPMLAGHLIAPSSTES
ncbi:uncharacterized protein ARMOST_02257 [Armillaria ostoyae]|uniref:Uncharacterized protein n=1 Tax=Armillaria ostoyae TaxID=47428 RepID=A0A284QR97_ARMOS|nr:uncharacterized protein ARMOST_02257 [Armillaria ostoyae]